MLVICSRVWVVEISQFCEWMLSFVRDMQSLVYSRVAAMVRACQFKIDDSLQPDEIPFCGQATVNKIRDIARSGTTEVLEAHRSGIHHLPCDCQFAA